MSEDGTPGEEVELTEDDDESTTKLEKVARKHGFVVVQRPKGHATIIFGGKHLAAAVRKREQAE